MANLISQVTPYGKTSDYGLRASAIQYGTCSTGASTAAKAVTCASFTSNYLTEGSVVAVKFSSTNIAAVADLTLNVNSTGAKAIKYVHNGNLESIPEAGFLKQNQVYLFYYDGTNWVILLDFDTNTEYTISSTNPTLSWGTTSTILSVNGTDYKVTMPSNPNSNNAVTQTISSTSDADYRILFSSTADDTTRTEGARKDTDFKYNPSTNNLTVSKINGTSVSSFLTAHQAVTDNNPTLEWGETSLVAAIGGTDVHVTMPEYLEPTYYVTFTKGANNVFSADKTFDEVETAYNDGYAVYGLYNNMVFYISAVQAGTGIGFSRNAAKAISNISWTKSSGNITYTYSTFDDYLELAGGVMTGKLQLDGAPTADLHAATKKYVDDNKYSHPTTTAATAAAVKVGKDSLGHVIIGNALTAADVGAATSGHTHTTSLAAGGTATINLSANTAYTLTAGGTNVIFKTPVDSDTKNTAGATDTSSKIFLIGATAQNANPQTYSDNEVYATSGVLTAKTFSGSGASLTSLNASNISSGTLAAARLPSVTRTNNTSTASPAHAATFTAIDSITTDTYGRVTAVNTKTVTLPSDNNTDTKVNVAARGTTKSYLMADTTSPTSTAAAHTAVAETGIYMTTTAGELNATQYKVNEAVTLQYNSTTKSLDFIFA